MNNWKPTTENMREEYGDNIPRRYEEFDRWLAEHDAEIRADEREKAAQRVEALEPKLDMSKWDGGYDCCGCSTLYRLFDEAVDAARGGEQE